MEAAVFSEIDHLSGITENIIMGQLAPYGTGSFDLVVDHELLVKHAHQVGPELEYNDNQGTPLLDEPGENPMTPIMMGTPDAYRGTSVYS